jgi:hypothetical protein
MKPVSRARLKKFEITTADLFDRGMFFDNSDDQIKFLDHHGSNDEPAAKEGEWHKAFLSVRNQDRPFPVMGNRVLMTAYITDESAELLRRFCWLNPDLRLMWSSSPIVGSGINDDIPRVDFETVQRSVRLVLASTEVEAAA